MKHRMSKKTIVLCIALALLTAGWTAYVVLEALVLESVSTEKPIEGPTVSRDTAISKVPVSVDWDDVSEDPGEETDEPDPNLSSGEASRDESGASDEPDPDQNSGGESGETSKNTSKATSKDTSKETSKNTSKSSSQTSETASEWSLPDGTSKVIGQYRDDDVAIRVTQYREYRSDIYVADIVLSSPEYLKTVLARDSYGKNLREKPTTMAERANAILAVNGDYYSARESGYVIRNGVLYRKNRRDNRKCLAIYDDGRFEIVSEARVSATELLERHAVQVLSFGPAVIVDGVVTADDKTEILDTTSPHNNPRTILAQVGPLHYIFMVVDGRTGVSKGMKLKDVGEFLLGLGCTQAYNLDGGGTSWIYFQGKVLNHPSVDGTYFGERSVSDIVCITKG
ncbi:MAG: phosphodiester glycosidase family protein [Clostridia bacterium]|nr:phosphodiester glycosidase family protein [Clostridia bacterium]